MPRFLRVLLTALPFLVLAYIYVGWKVYHACAGWLQIPSYYLNLMALGTLFWLCVYPLVLALLHLVLGSKKNPDGPVDNLVLDIFFAWPFWIGLILVCEILPLFLLLDFLKLPLYPLFDLSRVQWLGYQHRVVLVLTAGYLLHIMTRVLIDTIRIEVRQFSMPGAGISASVRGLRIVHISDIQFDRRTRVGRLRRYVKKVNNLKPDLVFFTGDLVAQDIRTSTLAARILGRVKARYGIYACLGDEDHRHGAREIVECLKENEIRTFDNKNELVQAGREYIMVSFITNTREQRTNLDNLNFLMGQQPRGVIDIAIMHQPSEIVVELAAERGYHLLLAGHTHGGQVIVRPCGIRLTPARMHTPFYRGTHLVNKMAVSINAGLGFRQVPLRYRSPAEVSLIEIGDDQVPIV